MGVMNFILDTQYCFVVPITTLIVITLKFKLK